MPTGPGLGVDLDMDVVDRLRVSPRLPWSFDVRLRAIDCRPLGACLYQVV